MKYYVFITKFHLLEKGEALLFYWSPLCLKEGCRLLTELKIAVTAYCCRRPVRLKERKGGCFVVAILSLGCFEKPQADSCLPMGFELVMRSYVAASCFAAALVRLTLC